MAKRNIHTIGYEGKDIVLFIQQLKDNQISILVDARIRAGGRKLDFCKKNLSLHLESNGIKYLHYRELGTPDYLMKEMKLKGHYSMDAYAIHLDSKPEVLDKVIEETQGNNIAIMCFEKNYQECHRTVVATKIADKTQSLVHHI
ncbi:MAG: DUF488 domain-containing protein [Bacteroidetes bacterium]|nr:DUF488 domain-containing protein [Bacteroidota bacterium]